MRVHVLTGAYAYALDSLSLSLSLSHTHTHTHTHTQGLILGWGLPVLALQWAFGGHVTCREHGLLLTGFWFPTLYLWFADALAIGLPFSAFFPLF